MLRVMRSVREALLVALAIALPLALGCRPRGAEVVVFHASSLTQTFGDVADLFQRENPDVRVRLEPSGSQVAARKVSELGMRADVVAVADAGIISRMLLPGHASYDITFATNEIVIAHKDHSRFTDEISTANWPEVLLRSGVVLGRTDADTASSGYHTLMAWQLAERAGTYGDNAKGLAGKLAARCAKEHVVNDEAELLAKLESRSIDYAFLYRSTAEDHHLKITALPPDQNLSRMDLADRYAAVQVEVRMKQGEGMARLTGAPVTYGLTIPTSAPRAAEARRFVAFLLGESGRRTLARRGFAPLHPARCGPCDGLPEDLLPLVQR
jgi:molybdate/tungstate transport system substrate-binding protein